MFSFLPPTNYKRAFIFYLLFFLLVLCFFLVASMTKWLCYEIMQVYNLWPLQNLHWVLKLPFMFLVISHYLLLVFSPCDLNFKSMWNNECVKNKLKQEVTSCKPYLLSANIWPSLSFLFLVSHLSPILTWILFFFTLLGFHLLDICWKNKCSIRQGSHVVEPCHKKVLWNNCMWDSGKGFFLQIYEIMSLAKRDIA